MLHPRNPPRSPDCYPGYGGSRVLFDGALTRGVDETGPLLIGLAWLITFTVAMAYRQATRPAVVAARHPAGPLGLLNGSLQSGEESHRDAGKMRTDPRTLEH